MNVLRHLNAFRPANVKKKRVGFTHDGRFRRNAGGRELEKI